MLLWHLEDWFLVFKCYDFIITRWTFLLSFIQWDHSKWSSVRCEIVQHKIGIMLSLAKEKIVGFMLFSWLFLVSHRVTDKNKAIYWMIKISKGWPEEELLLALFSYSQERVNRLWHRYTSIIPGYLCPWAWLYCWKWNVPDVFVEGWDFFNHISNMATTVETI